MIDLQLFFVLCGLVSCSHRTQILCFASIQFHCRVLTRMHPVVEYFDKCSQADNEELEIGERRSRLIREYLLRTSERCRGLTCVERMLSETSSLHRACNLICRIVGSANIHEAYIEFRRGHSHHDDDDHHHCT